MAKTPVVLPIVILLDDLGSSDFGLSVGINRRRPISERYADRGTFRYTGGITSVHIEPGAQPADTPMLLDEAAIQARMRAAAGVV